MHELVRAAITAHGDLEKWDRVLQISAAFTASGLGFKQRGPVGEAFTRLPMRVTVDAREMRTAFEPFVAVGQRGIYRPDRTVVETLDGRLVEELDDPRESLKTMVSGTAWSAPQVLYFVGYSLWMYLTLPFSFLADGMTCEEVEPWVEDGETWRGLKVTYPSSYPSHSTEQIHYFDAQGLMRRQDYTVDVRQNLSIAHYIYDHHPVGDFIFARKRRIYLRGPNGKPLQDKLLIAADLSDFQIIEKARLTSRDGCIDTCD